MYWKGLVQSKLSVTVNSALPHSSAKSVLREESAIPIWEREKLRCEWASVFERDQGTGSLHAEYLKFISGLNLVLSPSPLLFIFCLFVSIWNLYLRLWNVCYLKVFPAGRQTLSIPNLRLCLLLPYPLLTGINTQRDSLRGTANPRNPRPWSRRT